tara:strand:+ start:1954 stop:2106 length:153 start_codon:yes stop_codon:yes gene_type:complete
MAGGKGQQRVMEPDYDGMFKRRTNVVPTVEEIAKARAKALRDKKLARKNR